MEEDRLGVLALIRPDGSDGAHFVVNEEFPEKAKILAIQLQRQYKTSN